MDKQNKDPLESFIHETLRSVPARRAPVSLEQRVLAQISRRAARPWYRQDFRHWPASARIAFVVSSAGVAAVTLTLGLALYREGFGGGVEQWLAQLKQQWTSIQSLGGTLFALLPANATWWLAGFGIALASMSVATVGLGAAAYRLLWKNS